MPTSQQVFEAAARPLESEASVEGWVLVLRDVTKERQRRLYLQTQERLATVGQLAAGIAHDFNNLLMPILLYTDIVMAGMMEDSQSRANLLQVQTAALRAEGARVSDTSFWSPGATARTEAAAPATNCR